MLMRAFLSGNRSGTKETNAEEDDEDDDDDEDELLDDAEADADDEDDDDDEAGAPVATTEGWLTLHMAPAL